MVSAETGSLYIDIQPRALQASPLDGRDPASAAQLNSGMHLAVQHSLIDLSVNYRLQGDLYKNQTTNDLSQIFSGALSSRELNDLLRMEAVFKADSVVGTEGGRYRHQLTSAFSKTLSDYANLNIQYSYGLNKPSELELEQEVVDFSLGVQGHLIDGRLTWQGGYGESSALADLSLQQNTTTVMNFASRYRIAPALYVDLSGELREQQVYKEFEELDNFNARRLGAGLSWSPAADYAVSFKLNRLDDTRFAGSDLFGSGSVIWNPPMPWQVEIGYDDRLIEGLRGVVLRARVDLDNS